MNSCVKLLKDFVQDLRFILFDTFVIALLSSPRLPDSFSQLTTTLQLQFVTVKIQEIHFMDPVWESGIFLIVTNVDFGEF